MYFPSTPGKLSCTVCEGCQGPALGVDDRTCTGDLLEAALLTSCSPSPLTPSTTSADCRLNSSWSSFSAAAADAAAAA